MAGIGIQDRQPERPGVGEGGHSFVAEVLQTVWKVVNTAVGVTDFQSRAVGEPISPKVLLEGLEAARDGLLRSGLAFEAREGRFYALTAAIRPGTPTRVMARLML